MYMKETKKVGEVFAFSSVSIQNPTFLDYPGRISVLCNGYQFPSPASAGFHPGTVFSEQHGKFSIF